MKIKKIFQKRKVLFIVVMLALTVTALAVYFLGVLREEEVEVDPITVEEQVNEIDKIKKERGYTPPTDEEIQSQIEELGRLREEAKQGE